METHRHRQLGGPQKHIYTHIYTEVLNTYYRCHMLRSTDIYRGGKQRQGLLLQIQIELIILLKVVCILWVN